jgi:hypothetical protein
MMTELEQFNHGIQQGHLLIEIVQQNTGIDEH